jgi:hypothetical protein
LITSDDVNSQSRLLSLRDQELARLFNHLPEKFGSRGPSQARLLRVLGQVVDSIGLDDFELEAMNDNEYVMRGRIPKVARRLSWLKLLRLSFIKPQPAELEMVELRCSQETIERLDDLGRRRRRSLYGTPDPSSSSQVLRSVGRYLDSQDGLMQRITRTGETVTVQFESAYGRIENETKLVTQFIDSSERRFRQ